MPKKDLDNLELPASERNRVKREAGAGHLGGERTWLGLVRS